jgi:hypothetical protein
MWRFSKRSPPVPDPDRDKRRLAEIAAIRKQAREFSLKYRESGIALSATIITLSIAAMFYSSKSEQNIAPLFSFAIPICLSVCYQLIHFMAAKAQSRELALATTIRYLPEKLYI